MTNPNSVKSFIGCYKIVKPVQELGNWYLYRQGDSLACKEMDYKDAGVFAFYLGETFAPDPGAPFNGSTRKWFQFQSPVDGKWLDGSRYNSHDAPATFISADTPPTLDLTNNGGVFGFPPECGPIWMEYVKGKSVEAVFIMEHTSGTSGEVHWYSPTVAMLVFDLGDPPVTTAQVVPGSKDLYQIPYDQVDFGYLFLDNANFAGTRVTNCNLSNVTFKGAADFTGTVLDGSNLSGCVLDGTSFRKASLKDVNLSGASLKGCDFTGAVLDNCDFEGADLTGAVLYAATLADPAKPIRITRSDTNRTNFTNASVNKALTHALDDGDDIYDWSYALLDGASFMKPDPDHPGAAIPDGDLNGLVARYASLIGVQFSAANPLHMRDANLSNASLGGASLVGANLQSATFNGATLSTPKGKERCNLSKAYLLNVSFANADMSYAEMPYCYLFGNSATLSGANIMQADFTGAYLVAADFSSLDGKNAVGVTFDGACLVNAKFAGTDLSTVDQVRANSFVNACLQGADFSNAKAQGVNFAGAAVSTSGGTLLIEGGRENGHNISYDPTTTPTNTAGATCPNGTAGPCTGPMWNDPSAPMTVWHYNGDS